MFVFIWNVEADSPFREGYVVTSPYHATTGKGGERRNKLHEGIDIWCEDPIIFPVLPGEVVKTDWNSIFGYHVIIRHAVEINGIIDIFYSLYGHGSKIYYSAEGMVDTDTPIMKMGSSGYSSGDHLHIAMFRIVRVKRVYFDPGETIDLENESIGEYY
jgi:murein DD-endopeptidase MepM/ murein hydrolase activator NlpD